MIITDNNSLTSLYKKIIHEETRFKGVNPDIVKAIENAEQKVKWSIKQIEIDDAFFVKILYKMIPDNSDEMIKYDNTIDPRSGLHTKTMYTDGKHFFYNPAFVNTLTSQETESVVLHELLHIALGHHIEFSDIPKNRTDLWELANIAADLALNQLISQRSGFYKNMLLPGFPPYTDLPKNLDAREYFNILLRTYTPNSPKSPEPPKPDESKEPEENKEEKGEEGEKGEKDDNQSQQPSKPSEQEEKLKVNDMVEIPETGEYGMVTSINGNKVNTRPATASEVAKYLSS